jgi:hypothetical protein
LFAGLVFDIVIMLRVLSDIFVQKIVFFVILFTLAAQYASACWPIQKRAGETSNSLHPQRALRADIFTIATAQN